MLDEIDEWWWRESYGDFLSCWSVKKRFKQRKYNWISTIWLSLIDVFFYFISSVFKVKIWFQVSLQFESINNYWFMLIFFCSNRISVQKRRKRIDKEVVRVQTVIKKVLVLVKKHIRMMRQVQRQRIIMNRHCKRHLRCHPPVKVKISMVLQIIWAWSNRHRISTNSPHHLLNHHHRPMWFQQLQQQWEQQQRRRRQQRIMLRMIFFVRIPCISIMDQWIVFGQLIYMKIIRIPISTISIIQHQFMVEPIDSLSSCLHCTSVYVLFVFELLNKCMFRQNFCNYKILAMQFSLISDES